MGGNAKYYINWHVKTLLSNLKSDENEGAGGGEGRERHFKGGAELH